MPAFTQRGLALVVLSCSNSQGYAAVFLSSIQLMLPFFLSRSLNSLGIISSNSVFAILADQLFFEEISSIKLLMSDVLIYSSLSSSRASPVDAPNNKDGTS